MISKLSKFLPVLLLLAFFSPASTARANSVDVKIQLVAAPEFPGAKGTARFRDRTGEREFQVEVQVSPRLAGSVFTVSVDGVVAGQMTINALGAGRLSLNSKLGQTVPAVVPGSLLGVTTAAGAIVLAGRF